MAYIGSPAAPTIATVSDGTVTSNKLADDAVTSAKLANDAVTSAKIVDGAVTPSDLSTGHPNWDSSGNVGINNSNPDQYISSADTVLNITGSAVNTSPATLSMNGSSTILGRDFATTQVFGVTVSNTATEITRITGTSSNGFRMMVRITTSGHTGGVGNSSIYAMYYWDGGTGTPQQIFRYDSGASLGLSFDNSTSNVFIIKLASAGAAGNYQGTFMVEWFVPQDFAGGTWTIS